MKDAKPLTGAQRDAADIESYELKTCYQLSYLSFEQFYHLLLLFHWKSQM